MHSHCLWLLQAPGGRKAQRARRCTPTVSGQVRAPITTYESDRPDSHQRPVCRAQRLHADRCTHAGAGGPCLLWPFQKSHLTMTFLLIQRPLHAHLA